MRPKTHCRRGHEFTPENTYVSPKGHRSCRTCARKARWKRKDVSFQFKRALIPRDPEHRFRIYRMIHDALELVGTAKTPSEVGRTIITLGLEGKFKHSCIGLLDTYGVPAKEKRVHRADLQGKWVINPWDLGS